MIITELAHAIALQKFKVHNNNNNNNNYWRIVYYTNAI